MTLFLSAVKPLLQRADDDFLCLNAHFVSTTRSAGSVQVLHRIKHDLKVLLPFIVWIELIWLWSLSRVFTVWGSAVVRLFILPLVISSFSWNCFCFSPEMWVSCTAVLVPPDNFFFFLMRKEMYTDETAQCLWPLNSEAKGKFVQNFRLALMKWH